MRILFTPIDNCASDILHSACRHLSYMIFCCIEYILALASLEHPDASLRTGALSAPCGQHFVLACGARGDDLGCLRAGDEDEVQPFAEIICL